MNIVWHPDILGDGYEQTTIPLGHDHEGETVCTLIAHRPEKNPNKLEETPEKPLFALLYIHGWNDYFFQTELAEQIAACGGAFYAVDLQKYGRSLRPNHSFAYTSNLKAYDNDIKACLHIIHHEQGKNIPTLLMGHSTGGLTAALWAHRHPNKLAGLILNSPWLELQVSERKRPLIYLLTSLVSMRNPKKQMPSVGPNHYSVSLRGWKTSDGPLPSHLSSYPNDPSVVGFDIIDEWKLPEGAPVYSGWLKAILKAQRQVAKGLKITCPIHVGCSTHWTHAKKWTPQMRRADTILNTDLIVKRATNLGNHVTIDKFPAKHDLTLSDPEVRQDYFAQLRRWIRMYITGL
ncbi:alpha/beta hydrolase [Actinomyces sp. zg-332]|uniref:alpha/beta hydrolase n=1 Tax=Actinomyces sp. zg-332 TaxID=2708340 RepID=UPI00141E07DB|nr:alpha/beta hydrolase [Actinomyces sp. zg-332]QPK94055.1 alpha/beta hydrolase [Actinomyces sp. zg-332]